MQFGNYQSHSKTGIAKRKVTIFINVPRSVQGKKGRPKIKMKKNKIILLILLFPFILTTGIINSFAQIRTEVGKSEGWREVQFNFGSLEPPYFIFHPSGKQLILGGKGGKGISLLDIESGAIQELTTNIRHKYPHCSPDGRYIFFTLSTKRDYKNLYVFDTKTKNIELIYELDKVLPIFIIHGPLSPSGKYLIGPANWKEKITLPGGEIVTIVPIHGTIERGKLPKYLYSEWSSDSNKLFLYHYDGQIISIRDVKTGSEKDIQIRIEGYTARDIKPGPDPTKIYVLASSDKKKGVNLYMMDLRNPEKIPVLIINNFLQFDLDSYGNIVFSRLQEGYYKILIRDNTGKNDFIRQFREHPYPWDWSIMPRISKDGKVIAFFRKLGEKENAITVLAKEDK